MAYTKKELGEEFWMLTKGILQDSRVDTDEARVLIRWFEEHKSGDEFDAIHDRLGQFLADGWISDYESRQLLNTFGNILRMLRQG